jgi:hypothetical protein
MTAIRSVAAGAASVLRAPFTIAFVSALTLLSALPFALVMGERLQTALNDQPPIMLGSEEIDADWWLEFRRHAEGLSATYTPAIIGFAAPLSSLSVVLDGQVPPAAMWLPLGVALVVWAFLWGWAIERFKAEGSRSPSVLTRAAFASLPRFLAISLVAAVAQLVLYVTVHPLLFKLVFPLLTQAMPDERNAFVVRVLLYLVYGVFAVSVTLAADYARIASAAGGTARDGVIFVRSHWPSAAGVFVIIAIIVGIAFVLYGVGEAYGGSRVAGWRGVAIGQAFIILRLAMRLVTIASEVRLFESSAR